MDDERQFEDLLSSLVPQLTIDDQASDSDAAEIAVPPELKARIVALAETATALLLSEQLISKAHESGETRETLIAAARAEDTALAADVIDGKADPSRLGASAFARVLQTARVEGEELYELLAQTVAQFGLFYPKRRAKRWLRVLAARPPERGADDPRRDPDKARKAGLQFAEDVREELSRLQPL